jgi:uncharacterized protein with GYD domain
MPHYVLMTRLSMEVAQDPRGRKKVGAEWKKMVDELCPEVKWIAHYAVLGQYDFMDIYEAPDNDTAHKVSMISRVFGAVRAESWPAIKYDKFLGIADTVEEKIHKGS